MRSFIRLTAFFMALLVLVSGSGLAISIHTCGSSGEKETELFRRLDGCCSEKFPSECTSKVPEGIRGNCCSLKVAYHKVEVPSSGKVITVYVIAPVALEHPLCSSEPAVVFTSHLFPDPSPPPSTGLFSLYSSFII